MDPLKPWALSPLDPLPIYRQCWCVGVSCSGAGAAVLLWCWCFVVCVVWCGDGDGVWCGEYALPIEAVRRRCLCRSVLPR